MTKRSISLLTILTLCLILISACNNPAQEMESKENIKIGAILPLTDFGAYWGEPLRKGMQLAINDWLDEGQDVILLIEDSAGQVAKAMHAANKLISINNTDALFVSFTGPAGATSPIAYQNKILFLYDSFDPQYTKDNPYAFKSYFNIEQECGNFVKYAKSKNISKVAYVGPQLSFTQSCVDVISQGFGKDNLIVATTASHLETDYRPHLLKAKDFGAELIMSTSYEGNYISIFKQKEELGVDIPLFCTKGECFSQNVRDSVPAKVFEKTITYDFAIGSRL